MTYGERLPFLELSISCWLPHEMTGYATQNHLRLDSAELRN